MSSLGLALPMQCCAVLLLTLTAWAPQQAPLRQSVGVDNLAVEPVYWLVAQSNFSKEPLSGGDLIRFRAGVAQHLGRQRCRIAESQAEIEKGIDKDGGREVLYVEVKLPKVFLWAKCKDHEGIIKEIECDRDTGQRCVELALRDRFPTEISTHDEMCHRGKPCRVDNKLFIVPY